MAEENTPIETPETTAAEPVAAEAAAATEQAAASAEQVFCAVSKQMVPLEETIELERKKGEMLRIHRRYKKYED